jgi:hypothetical protein
VALLIRARDDWREEIRRSEPLREDPDPREAVVALRRIIERIADS